MAQKKRFDMFEIKAKLNEDKYQEEQEKGFKITIGEKIMHVIVALIAYSIFLSFTYSYGLEKVPFYLIVALLTLVLAYRIKVIVKMTDRKH